MGMNLLSWLLFGLVLGSITLASSTEKNKFLIVAMGINSIFFGVVLAHTILQHGLFGINLVPFFIAVGSIGGFMSLQRLLKQI